MNIPIVVVAFNRVHCLERLLTSLNRAEYPPEGVELIISIDRGDNADVLALAESFCWDYGKKTVLYREENLGLKRHILSCGNLSQKYDAIILLEDDLYVSRDFYKFAMEAYSFTRDNDRIGGVALYNHRLSQLSYKNFEPVCDGYDNWYFQYAASWGQMWTKQQWAGFMDWYHRNEDYDFSASLKIPDHIKDWGRHSWLKYNIAYLIETDRFFLYPRVGFSTNFSDAGVNHSVAETVFQVPLMHGPVGKPLNLRFSTPEESLAVYDAWMENRKLEAWLDGKEVCIDLYGEKSWFEDKPYLLTASRMKYAEAIRSFGREMRPHEMNIIEDVPGDRLTLYRLYPASRKTGETKIDKEADLDYFFRGLIYRYKKTAVGLFLKETAAKIKNRLRRRRK